LPIQITNYASLDNKNRPKRTQSETLHYSTVGLVYSKLLCEHGVRDT